MQGVGALSKGPVAAAGPSSFQAPMFSRQRTKASVGTSFPPASPHFLHSQRPLGERRQARGLLSWHSPGGGEACGLGKCRARAPDSAPGSGLQRCGSARCGCLAESAPSHGPPPSHCPLPLRFPLTSHGQDLQLPPSRRGRPFPAGLGPAGNCARAAGRTALCSQAQRCTAGLHQEGSQGVALGEPGPPHLEVLSPASAGLWRPAPQPIPFP